MASTRNINTRGNYELEVRGLKKQELYRANPISRKAEETLFAGHGLIQGRHPHSELSQNFTDVENFLFGIRANDLTDPVEPSRTMSCVPEIYMIQSLNIAKRGGMTTEQLRSSVKHSDIVLSKPFGGEPARYTF